MALRNKFTGIDPYAAQVVRLTTHVLIKRGRVPEADRQDVEQELMLDLLQRLPKFDASRASLRTFTARVVAHRATRIVAAVWAAREGARGAVSLHDEVRDVDGECVERWETLDVRDDRRRSSAPHAAQDLRLDVDAALRGLPRETRELCAALLRDTVTEIARATGVARGSIWHRLQPVRARLRAAGVDAYLPASGRFSEPVSK